MNDSIKIFIDGACQPNPGNGGIGIFVSRGINEEKFSLPLHGEATNNVAEYEALIFALNLILTKYNDLKEEIARLEVELQISENMHSVQKIKNDG